jgi:porphobilinogen synthase
MNAEVVPVSLVQRPRRNRKNAAARGAMRETNLSAGHLVLPLFVIEGEKQRIPINAMPGCARLSIDLIVETAKGTKYS